MAFKKIQASVDGAMADVTQAMAPIKRSGEKVEGIIDDAQAAGKIVIDLSELGGLIGMLLGDKPRISFELPPPRAG